MTDKMNVDRAPRLPLDVEVNCGVAGMAYSKNISTSGIAIISDYSMEIGKYIQLKFMLPGKETPISAYGKVTRSELISENFYENGLSFWEIDDLDKENLIAFFK